MKTVESVTKAKATGKAKVATKTAVVKKAVVKKDKTTNEAVQTLPPGSKTTQFNSPVYGKCNIYSVKERSYVQGKSLIRKGGWPFCAVRYRTISGSVGTYETFS